MSFQPSFARRRRCATSSRRPVLAFGGPAPALLLEVPPSGALRLFARAFAGAVDGALPTTDQENNHDQHRTARRQSRRRSRASLDQWRNGCRKLQPRHQQAKRDSEGKTFKDESGFTAKDTEWHRVTCFNGLGRVVAQHAVKGMLVSVRGRIHNSKWTEKDGIERYGYEIVADDVQFLGRSKASGEAGEAAGKDGDLPL